MNKQIDFSRGKNTYYSLAWLVVLLVIGGLAIYRSR